jgi:type I restriction enzyme S subunit
VTLKIDKSTWQRVRFGDVVDRSREQVDQASGSIERYVAGGHFTEEAVEVTRFGTPDDGGMGSTFTYAFHPGHVLYVSASWYLRKVGVATFDGVVADKTYVLESRDAAVLDQRFLPWILLSDELHSYAAAQSTGSMNARLLWSALSAFEFDLPPLDEQGRIADLLWVIERHRGSLVEVDAALADSQAPLMAVDADSFVTVNDVVTVARSGATPSRANSDFYGGGIPWLKSGEVTGDDISETEESISESGLARSATWLVPSGAIVVAMYGDGKTRGQVGRLGSPMCTNQAVLALVPDESKAEPDFLYYWLRSRQAELRSKGAGAAQKNLSKALVITEPFPNLSRDSQLAAKKKVLALDRARGKAASEVTELSRVRDSIVAQIFGGN